MLMLDHDDPSWWTLEISVTNFISSSPASAAADAAAPTSAVLPVGRRSTDPDHSLRTSN